MENKLLDDHDRISICLDIAEAMLEADGWGAELVEDDHGNESYSEDTQDRFNGYFEIVEGILHEHGLIDWGE